MRAFSLMGAWLTGLTAVAIAGCDSADPGGSGAGTGGPLCPPTFADCDSDPTNGCEGALETSVESCGACGVRCDAGAHEVPICAAGACTRVCEAGFADCDGDLASGCEAELSSDAVNCGACGVSCAEVCAKGACDVTALATGQAQPVFLALDDASVYWGNVGLTPGAGTLMKVSKVGGAAVTLAEGQLVPRTVAVDATSVYWVNFGAPGGGGGAVMKVAKDGGAPITLASDQEAPWGLAVAGGAVYWTSASEILTIQGADPPAMPIVLAGGQKRPLDIAVVGSEVYWVNTGTSGDPPSSDGEIMRMSQGGAPTVLVSGLAQPSGLIADEAGGYLYWHAGGAILRKPLGGGPEEVFLDALALPPWELAVDATTLYWTTATLLGGTVSAASLETRRETVLAPNQTYLWDVAVDAEHVYWTSVGDGVNAGTGAILRIDR